MERYEIWNHVHFRTSQMSRCTFIIVMNKRVSKLMIFNKCLDLPIKIFSARVINTETNETMYPIDPRKHIALEFSINNAGITVNHKDLGKYIS